MTALRRLCLQPGCDEISTGTYCPTHTRERKRIRNADRSTAADVVAASPTCSCTSSRCRRHRGRVCGATDDLTADHIIPLDRGGTNDGARAVLCRSCNSVKGTS